MLPDLERAADAPHSPVKKELSLWGWRRPGPDPYRARPYSMVTEVIFALLTPVENSECTLMAMP